MTTDPGSPVYQDQILAYDALGRLIQVAGLDGVKVDFAYDAFGNRMHQDVEYTTQAGYWAPVWESVLIGTDDQGVPTYADQIVDYELKYNGTDRDQDLWFAYDEMNRQVLVDGAINGDEDNLANLATGRGHRLEYDLDGNRVSDKHLGAEVYEYQPPQTGNWRWLDEYGFEQGGIPGVGGVVPTDPGTTEGETVDLTGDYGVLRFVWRFDPLLPKTYPSRAGAITEYYEYDAMGRLTDVTTDAYGEGFTLLGPDQRLTLESRHYDAASRVVEAGPLGALSEGFVNAFTGNASNAVSEKSRVSVYDANGRLSKQRTLNPDGNVDSEMEYDAGSGWTWQSDELVQATNDDGSLKFEEEPKPVYVQATNDDGTPKFDAYGNPVYVQQFDANGNPVVDADGNAVYVQATNEDGTPKFEAGQKPVYVQATDGTGLPKVDADGNPVYLRQLDADGNPVVDADGNPVYVQATNEDGTLKFDADGNPVYVPELDGTGALLFDGAGNPIWKTHKVDHFVEGGYDNAGNVKAYRTTSSGVTSYYHFTQRNYDGYREGVVTGYRSDNAGQPGVTVSRYDANGYMVSIDDGTKNVNDRTFVNDTGGRVLLKRQENRLLRQLVVDGNVLAVYGAGTDLKMPTDDQGNPRWNDNQGDVRPELPADHELLPGAVGRPVRGPLPATRSRASRRPRTATRASGT